MSKEKEDLINSWVEQEANSLFFIDIQDTELTKKEFDEDYNKTIGFFKLSSKFYSSLGKEKNDNSKSDETKGSIIYFRFNLFFMLCISILSFYFIYSLVDINNYLLPFILSCILMYFVLAKRIFLSNDFVNKCMAYTYSPKKIMTIKKDDVKTIFNLIALIKNKNNKIKTVLNHSMVISIIFSIYYAFSKDILFLLFSGMVLFSSSFLITYFHIEKKVMMAFLKNIIFKK